MIHELHRHFVLSVRNFGICNDDDGLWGCVGHVSIFSGSDHNSQFTLVIWIVWQCGWCRLQLFFVPVDDLWNYFRIDILQYVCRDSIASLVCTCYLHFEECPGMRDVMWPVLMNNVRVISRFDNEDDAMKGGKCMIGDICPTTLSFNDTYREKCEWGSPDEEGASPVFR